MKSDIAFILVRPKYHGNLGSVARALKNVGFTTLRLVQPEASLKHDEAKWMAVGAADLLKKVRIYSSIEEAAKDRQFLIGTTCRVGRKRGVPFLLPDIGEFLPTGKKIGILFGPEDKGLSNDELMRCHRTMMIPTRPRFRSLNLAQAVMLVAYEIQRSPGKSKAEVPEFFGKRPEILASVNFIEQMYDHFETMLQEIGFFPHQNPSAVMRKLRRIFARTALTVREVRMIRGICHQVLWRARQKDKAEVA
ncbi:MAG: RNA methyltransferase [Deltaproteobacteria bacterium]|nr:RNA methyltransferase [Deltaproteobacteria bacterium]